MEQGVDEIIGVREIGAPPCEEYREVSAFEPGIIGGDIDVPDLDLEDTNDTTATDIRAALGWTPNDRLTVDLSYMYQKIKLDNTYGQTSPGVLDPQEQFPFYGPVGQLSTQESNYDLFNITIKGNDFIRPLGVHDCIIHVAQKTDGAIPDMSITNILIEGNHFETALVEPINLFGCRDVRVLDNTVLMTSPIGHDVIVAQHFENISIENLTLNDSGNLLRIFHGNGNDDVLFLRLFGDSDPSVSYTSDGTVTKAEWLFDESAGTMAYNSAMDIPDAHCTLYGDAEWTGGCWGMILRLSLSMA